nr:MAG TPA: minor tail protein [Bacteriophage sp.]
MEDIVINFTGQVTEVENALEKVSAKIDDIESRLGNGFTSGAKNLVDSIRTELLNEKAYNPEAFSEIASGLSPYVSNKLDVAQNKISSLMDLLKTGDTSESAFFTSLNQQSAFLAASINDVLNNCKELKQVTSGLDKSQLKILNSSMPAIADSILTAGRGFLGIHGTGAPSVSTLAKTLLKTSTFKAGYDALAKEMKLDQTAQQQLLPVLTGTVLRSNMKYDYYKYARENSQGTLSKKDAEKYYYNFRDHLPDSLKSMPMNPTAITKAEIAASEAAKYDEVISRANYRKLVELAKENEVFRETLVNLGYGKYTANSKEAGVFSMISNRNMTKGTLAQIVGSTYYDQLKPAIEGNSVYYIPLGAENETEQRRIANRGNKRANQSFELLNMAQTINNGLAPLYMQEQYRPITDSEIKTRVGEVQRPRKDSYIVLSQIPEDFANGKLPEEKKVNWDWKNNRLTGTSSYIVMERSRMTELAGMHGNGTMGNGITGSVFDNPSMASKPKMLMVDYSDKILPKKEDGSLDYAAIAKGQWNEKAKEEIANIFTPNKQMMYTLDGENLVYNYPSVARSINGEKQTYVPVTVKNGGILMVEEEQYKKTSKSSLETYGANIFDNFEDPNTVYDYYENANKIFEARNRNLTPSISFSKVGGRIPKTSKIGLVDLKSVFGIDGAMFAMPGYIPGQNATIRMPGMNLKGVAQTFDWKSAIKDAYSLKDGDPFYVPGLNTPKELKNLYENGGLKAIQDNDIWGKEHYGNTLSKYFSDIMKLDMLIGDSLIKSPIFGVNELNYLSGADADAFMRDRLERMPEEDKFRLVETAAQHSTTRQLGLGTQMSQNLVMTKEDYAKNKALWEDYITQLSSNEEYQKKYVFNTNDAVDVTFREDPSILERTPAAQTRLQEALNAARLAMRKGQIFGRGEGSKISMYMALANPGMFMLKAAKANGYIGNGNEDAFKLGTGVIAGSPTLGQTSIAGGRFPNTFLEQFGLTPSVKMNELIKSGKYGLGKDGVYADADTLAKMGGGDFDGDQIQLVTGWIADIFKRTEKVRTEQIKSHIKQEAEEEMKKIGMPTDKNGNKIRTPSMIGDYLGRSVASSIFMGQVSNAMDSLSEIDWDNEEEVTRFAQAAVNLRKFYDIDSTYAKTGILKQLSFEDGTKRAELLGRPFTSVYKGLASAIENNDFTKMADFSKTNFASIYSNKTGIMMAALRGIPGDRTSYDKLINAQRDKQGITQDIPLDGEEIKTVENARAVYLDKNIKAMADQLLYGKVISTETAEDLESSLRIYSDMLGKELDSANGTSDLVRREKLQKFKWELNAQQRRINFLKNYGMTQANRDLGAGVAGYGMLSDVSMTGEDSAFERGLKEKEKELDQDNLRELRLNTIKAATAVADANEKLLPNGLTLEQVQNEKRASAIRRANSLNYSYTMLSAFENANTPVKRKQWYDQYILGKDVKTFNPYSVLGKAFHDTAQIWEEETMNNQLGIENKEVHSIDKLIDTFEEKLLKSQDDGHVYFKKNKDNSIQAITGEHALTDRIESAKKTLRDLPEIFKDYEFLAVEQEVNLGDKAPKKIGENGSVSTNGRLDTIVRDKNTGEIIILDWKGNVKNASPEQLAMYANSRFPEGTLPAGKDGVDKVGFISYLDNNLEKRFKADMSKVTEGISGKGIEHTTGLIQDIQTLAMRTGFSERAMLREGQKWVGAREFSDDQWAIAEQIVFADMLNELSETGQYREANRSRLEQGGFTSDQIAAMNRQNINDALNDITIKNAIGTGGLDGYVAAQQKYDKMKQWEDALNQISNNISMATYKSNSRAFPAVRNTWLNYNKQIEDSQKELDAMLGSKLIDDERYANYKQRIEDAQTSYYESLSTVSFTDMMAASDRMMKQLSSPAKQTAVTGFAEQFDHLTKRIEYATQAYHALESSIVYEENEKGDKFVSPNSPITEDFLRERTNQFNELKDQEAKLKDEILRKSSIAFDSDFQRMSDFSKYGKLTADTTIKEKISSFNQRLSDARLQLEQDYKDGYLTGNEKEYTRRKSMLDSIRQEDYENTLYAQEEKNSDKLLNQYNKFERRNNMRSGRNVYRQMLNRREDSIDALKNYKEAMSEKQTLWKERAEQIRAGWGKEDIARTGDALGYMNLDSWKQASSEVQKYGAAIASVQKQLDSFGNKHTKIAAGAEAMIASMNNMITMYARRFARQLVQQAAQFVKQYDAAITEIQVVTRKSDEEVNQLGENMMKVAKDLKVSFSDVAKATTELYRQGLSDEEVDERREQVLKFSKVAGVSATDATKLITVGVNSGLFKDAKEVTDVVTALGDSAATNAGQIQKGIQKAGYAAKEAGVSGKELSAMLTVITAGTQLSGNVAGTTLRNVFSRINRVKNPNEVVYDEKGNAMTANTLAAVLNSAGISMYENGQMKGTTQILTDIGKVWDSLSDNKKNQIAYQLGGTQQYSNVAALMAGFSETDENGQTLMEKYLQLADESGNIVDEKYVDQADSLTAALTNLSNAFNALTSSVTDSEAIKGFVNMLAIALEGVAGLNTALSGVPALIAGIGVALVALSTIFSTHPVIAGALATIGALGTIYGLMTSKKPDYKKQTIEQITQMSSENEKKENKINELVNKIETINEKAQNGTATKEDLTQYNSVASELQSLGITSIKTASSLEELMANASDAATELGNAANSAKDLSAQNQGQVLRTGYNSMLNTLAQDALDMNREQSASENNRNATLSFLEDSFEPTDMENDEWIRWNDKLKEVWNNGEVDEERFNELLRDNPYFLNAEKYGDSNAINGVVSLIKSGVLDIDNVRLKNSYGTNSGIAQGMYIQGLTDEQLAIAASDPAIQLALFKYFYPQYGDYVDQDYALMDKITDAKTEYVEAKDSVSDIRRRAGKGVLDKRDSLEAASDSLYSYEDKIRALYSSYPSNEDFQNAILSQNTVLSEDVLRLIQDERVQDLALALLKDGKFGGLEDIRLENDHIISSALLPQSHILKGTKLSSLSDHDLKQVVDDPVMAKNIIAYLGEPLLNSESQEDFLDAIYPIEGLKEANLNASRAAINMHLADNFFKNFSPKFDLSNISAPGLGDRNREYLESLYSKVPMIANSEYYAQILDSIVEELNQNPDKYIDKEHGNTVKTDALNDLVVGNFVTEDGMVSQDRINEYAKNHHFIVSEETANGENEQSFNLGAIATSAASLSTDNKYGNAAAKMYWKLLATDGTPAERFGSLMDMINNDRTLQPIVEAMISDSDHSELAKAFSYMFKSDSTDGGNYEIKEDLSDLDIAALMVALANADESGTLSAYNHQSKQVVSSNAMTVLKALRKNPEKISEEWGSLGKGNSIVAEMLRDNFSTILGEETTSKLLNGHLNDLGMNYAERMISAYGNESAGYTDYEYAGLAEQVLGGLDANLTPEAKLTYINSLPTEMIDALKEKISGFEDYVNLATMSAEGKANSGVTDAKVADARKAFELGISDAKIRDLEKYNENLDELATLLTQVGKGGKNAADVMQTINSKMDQNRYNRWALNQYKSGDRSETVTKQLSSGFGIDQAELKEASKSSADFFIKSMEQELEGQTTELNNTASIVLNEMWQDVRQTIPESFDLDSYIGIGGVFNVSGFLNACREAGIEIDAGWAALVANAAAHSATLRLTADGNKLSIDVSGTSAKPKSSGGGGGGKSDADKLVDKIKKGQALYEHRVKMVQYKQTEYTNADELTNYGRMIEKEMEIEQFYLPVVQENIQKLKEQMAKTKVGSDDWYTLRDAILSAEETYEEINKTLDENKKKLEENQQAILKLHTDLEDSVTEEIKNRIQKERDMTDGAVTMQETILNAIKQRHQDEWDLIKKDIEKKKEALEEEKSLIDERLQARKDAEDEAEKYEELAELKKQLASVEMDSSRTKDAAQLRKSIADLEKEIGWDIADKEADNAKNEIQDQMDAYDDYITKGDEDLEELLKDANNFSEEVNNVLKMNQSELFDWLKNNVKEYTESLKDAQQQMVNSWSDTYKQMMGLTDTYWDEVAEILSSKESYLEYMKNSDEYLNASDDMKAQLRYQWEDAYDKWILALKDTTNYDHFDNGLGDMSGSEYGTGTNSGTGANGNKTTSPSGLSTMIKNAIDTVKKSLFGGLAWDKPNVSKEVLNRIVRGKFATGGIANYTGLAWLDGTPLKPERVLNAQQTESFDRLVNVMDSLRASGVSIESLRNSMLDTRIHLPNLSPSIDPATIGGNVANIGDVNITIEEAELNDDRDYDEIAQIVGEKFAKEISKQGINIAKYNF